MTDMKQIVVDVDVNRVIEANRLSFAESENDILRRLLLSETSIGSIPPVAALQQVTELDAPQFGSRQMGHWQASVSGATVAATSLKDAYCKFLLLAHRRDALFLERFAKHIGRTRRFVARDPKALYMKSPHLAREHAVELTPGWFVDCNLSEAQIGQRTRAAARELGISYGSDAWIREATRTI